MAEKAPCRWATETWDCSHPLVRHLVGSSGCWMKSLPWISPATCDGCPCHEPANLPEFPDSSTAPPDTQRTDPQDEYTAPLRMQFSLTPSDAKCVLIGPNGERREFPADTPYDVINAAAQAMNRTDPPKTGHDTP